MKTIYKLILIVVYISVANACDGGDSVGSGDSVGQGGSMARFTILDDYLYTVDNSTLKIFELLNPAEPYYLDLRDVQLGFGIETIFSKDSLLFIGSQDGMYIYSVTTPDRPAQLSCVQHIRSCDPVVASGDYAYVTLNSQNEWCGRRSNVLKIYDISDLRNPVEKHTETLSSPRGLGIDGDKLFVCDATNIKMYNIGRPDTVVWTGDLQHTNIRVTQYDVIPVNGLLLASTDKGLYQFDYTGGQLEFVSEITVKK
ncbi:MAG: hypothetical protein LBE71_00585 [Dysgonamonadaceae bacterium]|jgi:hypothetical protein|nr:hypothetical protein [Dysgonamonadaceae bacterium]